ncbi:MAG: DUF4830 domain-containing protein [Candidatus Methanoperedens sp.]|nr:DUF4830 domain-containing protein [Candidatus Methanoperedens sp.]
MVIIIGCVDTQPQKETLVQEDLDKVGIRTSGFNKQLSVNLPETFSDANWGLKKIICEEGGYDLAKYANQAVNIYSYRSNRYYEKEQLNVWVITDENEVICMYLTVNKLCAPECENIDRAIGYNYIIQGHQLEASEPGRDYRD